MKANIKIALVLLSSSFYAQAQVSDFEVEWGTKVKTNGKNVTDIYYTGDSSSFYVLTLANSLLAESSYLEKFQGLEEVNSKELRSNRTLNGFSRFSILELDNSLFALNLEQNRDQISLSVQEIDKTSLGLSGTNGMIYNFKLNDSPLIRNNKNYSVGEYKSSISDGEKKIVYAIEHPGKIRSKMTTTVKVFDNNFDLKWSTKYTLPQELGLSSIDTVLVSDNGDVYILTKVWKPENEHRRRTRNYDYFIHLVTKDGLVKNHKLKLKDNYFAKIRLKISKNGDLICAGFYSQTGYNYDGIFYVTLNSQNFSIGDQDLKKFDLDFITDGIGPILAARVRKSASKGKSVGFRHLDLRELILDDGGAILVAEQAYIFQSSSTDFNGNAQLQTHYHYNDIFIFRMDPQGNLLWTNRIKKKQHTVNDKGTLSSYFLYKNENNLNFMFNYTEGFNNTKGHEMILGIVSIDKDGNRIDGELASFFKSSLIKNDKVVIRPKSCKAISDNEFILYALGKKYYQFIRVKVK